MVVVVVLVFVVVVALVFVVVALFWELAVVTNNKVTQKIENVLILCY